MEFNSVRGEDRAVKAGIRQGRFANVVMPFPDRQLGCNGQRTTTRAAIDNFHQS